MAANKLCLDVFIPSSCGKLVKCTICQCWLHAVSEKFISTHVAGRKHKEHLETRRKQEKKLQCSVYIKGFDPLLSKLEDKLLKYFTDMGANVKDIYIDKNSASYGIVEFMEKEDVDTVLDFQRPFFHDKKLVVKRRELPKKNSSTMTDLKLAGVNIVNSLLPNELEDEMKKKDTVEQMKLLREFFLLTEEEIHLRNLICQLIENVLEELYPGCKVILFGSSANGLGEKGCDVDMTLIAKDITDEGTICNEIREVIQRFAPGCKNVSVVQSTKTCSIVKFLHTESNLSVDLSLNNYLAIHNTELLKTYMNLDKRIPLITFAVRKWSKCFGLAGRNNCQITQYSLTLMVIYFLQQLQPPVLPCLQECHASDEVKIEQWNCCFCKHEKHNNLDDKLTASDLLFKFFDFYCSFDFNNNIVAIHTLSVLSREDVNATVNKLNLGDACEDFKFSSPLVIQDPFKLTHNVSHNLSPNGLQLLKDYFRQACSFQDEQGVGLLSLTQLFTQKKKTSSRQKQKRKRNRSNIYTISLLNCKHVCDHSEVVCFDYIQNVLTEDLRMRISEINVKNEDARIMIFELTDTKFNEGSDQLGVGREDTKTKGSDQLDAKRTDTKLKEDSDQLGVKRTDTKLKEESDQQDVGRTDTKTKGCDQLDVRRTDTEIKDSDQLAVGRTDVSSSSCSLKRNADEVGTEGLMHKRMKTESIVCITFTATAYADTWTNRRKQRRLIQKLQQNDNSKIEAPPEVNEDADSGIVMSDVSITNTDTPKLPTETENHILLQFNVIITKASNENEICQLKLEAPDDIKNLQGFQTFYAYIKKELISVFK